MESKFDLAKEISEITDPKALRVIHYLLEKIKVLEERISVLEKNSSNSSKPPSSDIVKPLHEQRQPGVRHAGGQPKHPGVKHKLKHLEQVDQVQEYKLESCPECGGGVIETNRVKVFQQYELLEKPVVLIEHRQKQCRCVGCKKLFYAQLPDEVIENQICGVRLQSFVHYSKSVTGMSFSDLKEMLKDVFKVAVPRSTLCNIIQRGSSSLVPAHTDLHQRVKNQSNLHIDETGWYKSGYLQWCWNFCNEKIAYFEIRDTRSSKVAKEVLGEKFQGGVTTDFYNAYTFFDKQKHQFCLAHLIRDIKFLTTLPSESDKDFGNKLLWYFKRIFTLWNQSEIEKVGRLKKHIKKLHNFLARAKTYGKSLKLQKRILKWWDCLFRFIDQPKLFAPTNNEAERTFRFVTKIRKLTHGSRSDWGVLATQRSLSIVATCRKQNVSIFNFMQKAFSNFYFKNPYSSYFIS